MLFLWILWIWISSVFLLRPSESVFTENDKIYNETEARELFEMLASVHSKYPDGCLNAGFHDPKTRPKLVKRMEFGCDILNSKCTFGVFEIAHLKQLVIAVRGTQSMGQFFFEFMSFFIPDTSFRGLGEINFYFSKTFEVVFEEMSKFLTDRKFINHDVIFTGHSLGGSLAALSAMETILKGIRNSSQIKVLTFAEPRTGNLVFAKNYDRIVNYSFRIVNGLDVLAHLPACHKDYRYWPRLDMPCDARSRTGPYHHSLEIWYPDGMDDGAKYIVCSGSQGEEAFCSDKMKITVANFGKGITDHRKYFGKMIAQYGRSHCDKTRTFDENEGMLGKMKMISEVIHKLV